MSVKVSTYGGKIGWLARKYIPLFASNAYLSMQYKKRYKMSIRYINNFLTLELKPKPLNFLIETINRCNSNCDFCAASIKYEKRPFCKMEKDLFIKIIDQIAEWDYDGYISLFVNNEPFMDQRTFEQHKYIRNKLPNAKIKIFTNGLLLNIDKFKQIAPYVDLLIINNYCENMKLHKNIEELLQYLKNNAEVHRNIEIEIKIRYIHEVLSNRAGSSPNKSVVPKIVKEPCLFPFTDMVIYPNGKVGLCCCDVRETTNLGDINMDSIQNIWYGKKFNTIRNKLKEGRNGNVFCEQCDFVDTGLRVKLCKEGMKNGK